MNTPQEQIEALVRKHFPKPVKVELTFKDDVRQWDSYEQKIGLPVDKSDDIRFDPPLMPKDVPFVHTFKGYILSARTWEPSFTFECIPKHGAFRGGVYYDCVKSIKVI